MPHADIDQRFSHLARKLLRTQTILQARAELLNAFKTAWKREPKAIEYVECVYDWTDWFTDSGTAMYVASIRIQQPDGGCCGRGV